MTRRDTRSPNCPRSRSSSDLGDWPTRRDRRLPWHRSKYKGRRAIQVPVSYFLLPHPLRRAPLISERRGAMSAILSRRHQDRFRSRAHEALDQWLDRVETQMSERGSCAPTLLEITASMSKSAPGSPRPWWKPSSNAATAISWQEEAAWCKGLLRARPSRSRTVETLLGPVTLGVPISTALAVTTGSIRWTRPWACRGSARSGVAGRGQAGAGDAPPARRRCSHRRHEL